MLSKLCTVTAILALFVQGSVATKVPDVSVADHAMGPGFAIPDGFQSCILTFSAKSTGDPIVRLGPTSEFPSPSQPAENDFAGVWAGPYGRSSIYYQFRYDTGAQSLSPQPGGSLTDSSNYVPFWMAFDSSSIVLGAGSDASKGNITKTSSAVPVSTYSKYLAFSTWGGSASYTNIDLTCTMPPPSPVLVPTLPSPPYTIVLPFSDAQLADRQKTETIAIPSNYKDCVVAVSGSGAGDIVILHSEENVSVEDSAYAAVFGGGYGRSSLYASPFKYDVNVAALAQILGSVMSDSQERLFWSKFESVTGNWSMGLDNYDNDAYLWKAVGSTVTAKFNYITLACWGDGCRVHGAKIMCQLTPPPPTTTVITVTDVKSTTILSVSVLPTTILSTIVETITPTPVTQVITQTAVSVYTTEVLTTVTLPGQTVVQTATVIQNVTQTLAPQVTTVVGYRVPVTVVETQTVYATSVVTSVVPVYTAGNQVAGSYQTSYYTVTQPSPVCVTTTYDTYQATPPPMQVTTQVISIPTSYIAPPVSVQSVATKEITVISVSFFMGFLSLLAF